MNAGGSKGGRAGAPSGAGVRPAPAEPQTLEDADLEAQLALVLSHPGMSAWLKGALAGALEHDPVAVVNELEILAAILRRRAALHVARALHARNRGRVAAQSCVESRRAT